MDQKADKIHITPLGDHWEIEAESGKPSHMRRINARR
jgi:hypothetical protein